LPYGNRDTTQLLLSHTTGQKQYELTDHLGDVLATISDERKLNQWTDTIPYYLPAIMSESDYYPFGMLMPGRNLVDDKTHCTEVTITKDVMMPHTVNRSWPDGLETAIGHATILPGGPPLNVLLPGVGDGVKCVIPATPGVSQTITINVGSMIPAGPVVASMAGLAGSVTIPGPGAWSFSYIPTATTCTLQITRSSPLPPPPIMMTIQGIIWDSITISPELVTVNMCNENQYEYGNNGQMKVNEWAGVGNHYTAKFWDYDTRTGRRGNLDPKPRASISDYSTYEGNPIWRYDPLGDTPVPKGNMKSAKELVDDLNKNSPTKFQINEKGLIEPYLDVNPAFEKQPTSRKLADDMIKACERPGYQNYNFVDNDPDVYFDSYITGKVDAADYHAVGAYPEFQAARLDHLIVERTNSTNWSNDCNKRDDVFYTAHGEGLISESKVLYEMKGMPGAGKPRYDNERYSDNPKYTVRDYEYGNIKYKVEIINGSKPVITVIRTDNFKK